MVSELPRSAGPLAYRESANALGSTVMCRPALESRSGEEHSAHLAAIPAARRSQLCTAALNVDLVHSALQGPLENLVLAEGSARRGTSRE